MVDSPKIGVQLRTQAASTPALEFMAKCVLGQYWMHKLVFMSFSYLNKLAEQVVTHFLRTGSA